MARRNTRSTTRRNTGRTAQTRPRARRQTRRKRPFVLRWYHLLICFISAFCLGFIFAFGYAPHYVATVAGLR